ncbi:hypothetical protein ARMSODRAFT_162393 [Armillaria solidipes]|uniref:Uncharacterized protein n=1 Tax=Armillaria solidipes TaxID=1076256 RepID=A0A2H3BF01_9AGAR|nr:hypothetical protein ARMSODRAFT_162393 [Armillaria solidipes]
MCVIGRCCSYSATLFTSRCFCSQVLDNISVLCSSCERLPQRSAPTLVPWSRLNTERGLISFLGGEIAELLTTGSGYKTRPCFTFTSEAVDGASKHT